MFIVRTGLVQAASANVPQLHCRMTVFQDSEGNSFLMLVIDLPAQAANKLQVMMVVFVWLTGVPEELDHQTILHSKGQKRVSIAVYANVLLSVFSVYAPYYEFCRECF